MDFQPLIYDDKKKINWVSIILILVLIYLMFGDTIKKMLCKACGKKEGFEEIVNAKDLCVIDKTETDVDNYVQKKLLRGREIEQYEPTCQIDKVVFPETQDFTERKQNDESLTELINFRDWSYQPSRNADSVDKVVSLYLDGNESIAKYNEGVKIGNLFDELTSGRKSRECASIPHLDRINANQFGLHGASNVWLTQ